MGAVQFTLFETPVGPCALIWGEAGLLAVQLPEGSAAATRARVARRRPEAVEAAPGPEVVAVRDAILALLGGAARDLAEVRLDESGLSDFDRRVYAVARAIPPGETSTYGAVAARIGEPGAARAVGRAMGANPWPIVVPCHRVLAAGGRIGGFSADGGAVTKRRLLAIEGVGTPSLFDGPVPVRG